MTANMIKMLIDTWVIKRWDLKGKVTLEAMRQGILEMVFQGILDPEKRGIRTGRTEDRLIRG
jgi:hypothetical protein